MRWAALLFAVFALAGCDKKSDAAESSGARKVAVTVDAKGFTPSSVDAKKGDKLQLVFTRTTDDTCAKEVVFPEINLTKPLPLNTAVAIDVPTDAARTLTFQCGMAMFKSKVVIN
jgi:plastocyanin domain-containing protein